MLYNIAISIMVLCFICSFLSTIRICIFRIYPLELENNLWQFLTNRNWYIVSFFIVAYCVGTFARGEVSPMPWVQYSKSLRLHGELDAIFSSCIVFMTDLIIFFGVAEFKIQEINKKITDSDNDYYKDSLISHLRHYERLYYLVNFLVGLILISKWNPLYQFISLFVSSGDPYEFIGFH